MWSVKSGRGPSFQRAIGGLVAGLFGVLWTILAVSITVHAPFPWVGFLFPAFGVMFTLLAWGGALYNLINATSQQRFSEYDFVAQPDEPDPLQRRFAGPPPSAVTFCPSCGQTLQPSFKFCPNCGQPAASDGG